MNALDDLQLAEFGTVVKRYGSTTSPFYQEVKTLAKEVLDRMKIPAAEVEVDKAVNREASMHFQRA